MSDQTEKITFFTEEEAEQEIERRVQEALQEEESQRKQREQETERLKRAVIDQVKTLELMNSGFKPGEIDRYKKFIEDTTDREQAKAQAEEIAEDVLTKGPKPYGDPSPRRAAKWSPFD